MDNLFSDDPQFRRVQYKKLSDNVREWQQEISAMCAEKLPKDLGVDVTVVFQQLDDEKGYAVGTAIAKETSTDKTVGIPIIVKSWHLAPLDLFFSEGKLYPISDENLAKIFYQTSLGSGLAPTKPPPNMADDVFADTRNPPLGGKYSYSAPFSALRLISGTLGAEDLKLFKQAVAKQPNALSAFGRHRTFDVLRKYAEEKPSVTPQDEQNKEDTSAVFTIKKDGPNAYRMYGAPDGVFDPVLVTATREGVREFLKMRTAEFASVEKDPMSVADQNGYFTLEAPPTVYGNDISGAAAGSGVDGSGGYAAQLGPRKNPFVFDPRADDRTVVNVDSFGRYAVRDRDGVLAKGWVIPNVVNFDGNAAGIKLFLSKALGAIQSRIAGIAVPDDDDTFLEPDRPDTGKIGVLVYRDGKDVLATCPFRVTSVCVYKGLRSIGVIDYKDTQANLIISPNVNGIVPVSDSNKDPRLAPLLGPKKNYLVSAKMVFITMPRLCPVSESADDFKKMAAPFLDLQPLKVAWANGKYIFRGGQIPKLAAAMTKVAFNFNALPRHEAEFLLASWKLPMAKIAEVLDKTPRHIQLEVHHLNWPATERQVKTASPARLQLIASMKAPFSDLVKIASELDDAQSVDSVLSLGFINPENVARFASAKPMLWEVSHMLAKLLLASRLGMSDIPEESVRASLSHIQRVIDGLGRLRMLEEQKVVKTASQKGAPQHRGGRLLRGGEPIGFAR